MIYRVQLDPLKGLLIADGEVSPHKKTTSTGRRGNGNLNSPGYGVAPDEALLSIEDD